MNTSSTKQRKDHPVRWAILVAVLTIITLAGFNFLVLEGSAQMFNFEADEAKDKEEEEDNENTLIPINLETNIPAVTFLNQLAENAPEGLSSPSIDFAANPNNALSWVCNYEPNPFPVAAMNISHPSEDASVTVHAYGAGQGAQALANSRSAISSCAGRQGTGGIYTTGSVVPDTDGFSATSSSGDDRQYVSFFIRSDVLVSVSSPSFGRTTDISEMYDDLIMDLLPPVCENLEVSNEDAKRNPYYDRESYAGWQRGRPVTIYTDSDPDFVPGVLSAHEETSGESLPRGNFPEGTVFITNPSEGVRLSYNSPPSFTRPLDPVPVEMPDPVEEPDSPPNIPERPSIDRTVPERVEDPIGPGCGWDFTSLNPPPFDATEEKERADQEEERVRAEMRELYADYLTNRRSFIFDYADYAKTVTKYQEYVEQVREVGNQWQYVNNVRADYRSRLDAYWRDLENYTTFNERLAQAQEEYDAAVQQCRTDLPETQDEWRDEMDRYEELMEEREEAIERAREQETPNPGDPENNPSPAPSPTPTVTIPPEPEHPGDMPTLEDCLPERPSILDERQPTEPVPPTPPADVELPSSWTDIP